MNKYWVGGEQTEYQPGSDELVLANLLDIVDPDEINDVELSYCFYQSCMTKS